MTKQKKDKTTDEKVNPNEPVFKGGPTYNQVENWKQKYNSIYSTHFDDQSFVFRTIGRTEYKTLINGIEGSTNNLSWHREEALCDKCVLWPENYESDDMGNGTAGTPTVLAEYILDKSGFNSQGPPKKL